MSLGHRIRMYFQWFTLIGGELLLVFILISLASYLSTLIASSILSGMFTDEIMWILRIAFVALILAFTAEVVRKIDKEYIHGGGWLRRRLKLLI